MASYITNKYVCKLGLSTLTPTCVDDELNNTRHLSLEDWVEDFDNEDQAGAQHQQRDSQQDQTHRQVRQVWVRKQMPALEKKKQLNAQLHRLCVFRFPLSHHNSALQAFLTNNHYMIEGFLCLLGFFLPL